MNVLKKLLPNTTSFFGFFDRHSRLAKEACAELDGLVAHPGEFEARSARITEIEHAADDVARRCIDALHNTFITPFDRSDIHRLIRRLDDIIDAVDSIAARMRMYQVTSVRKEIPQLTRVLMEAIEGVERGIHDLPRLSERAEAIQKHCWAVYDAESRADTVMRAALVRLFEEEKDPLLVIKWKEIFERLERTTDRCKEAAHIISGIVIEAS
jgi:hypothetical protein